MVIKPRPKFLGIRTKQISFSKNGWQTQVPSHFTENKHIFKNITNTDEYKK